jgi:hypothetical protein
MRGKVTYNPARDYYAILGIEAGATVEEIRQAYRRCVREVHPDLNPDRAEWATEQIQLINEAYDVLRQPLRRKEYDRLRWPHVRMHPPRRDTTYRSPSSAPAYDPSRPWWEQPGGHVPRRRAPAAQARQSRNSAVAPEQPYWLAVSAWLKGHGLTRLEPTWLLLVGLWRSPYAGLLSVLGTVLAINVAVIIYAFIEPQSAKGLLGLFSSHTEVAGPGPTLTFTLDRLYQTCGNPDVAISTPVAGDIVGDSFSVYGTVQAPGMWAYRIEVGYLGPVYTLGAVPTKWVEMRSPPHNQSIPEPPIVDDLLTEIPLDLTGQPAGYYAIRLIVVLRDGEPVEPCDVVVRR